MASTTRPGTAARPADMKNDNEGVRTYIWHLWPGRNYPATAVEEAQFVSEMRAKAETTRPKTDGKKKRQAIDRGDVTSVVNALRCGLTFSELSTRAPGLKAHRLLDAYEEIERLREQSVTAWLRMVEESSLEGIVNWASAAAVLMGTPVRRVQPASANVDDKTIAEQVRLCHEKVMGTNRRAERVEGILNEGRVSAREAVELGRLLYDPYDPSLWADPYFLPTRVGTLMPLRLADLLGERHP